MAQDHVRYYRILMGEGSSCRATLVSLRRNRIFDSFGRTAQVRVVDIN